MPIDNDIILHSLINVFSQTLGISICENAELFLKSNLKKYSKLSVEEKVYHTKYSVQMAETLMKYLEKVSFFEMNIDPDHDIIHDFRLIWKKDNIAHISLSHITINVRDIIPGKIMKICGYNRGTNICKGYTEYYQNINDNGYNKIKFYEKYSEMSDKNKNKIILDPVRNLVYNTLSKKRKCSQRLYNHLLGENDRIVFRLYKNRFVLYDFGKNTDSVESFKMKIDPSTNDLIITFNNKAMFILSLQINAFMIKPHLSMKFKTIFKNMDELYSVDSSSI